MDPPSFRYVPQCAFSEGEVRATYKVAAPWTYGAMHELKTYALCREEYLEVAVARARREVAKLSLAEGETLGEIAVYPLSPGTHDPKRQCPPTGENAGVSM